MTYTSKKTNSPILDPEELRARIPGWGVDLDYKNRPSIPKERKPPQGTGAHWVLPERQIPRVKILRSIEHRELTPVFGTSCPPKGLSGVIRTLAYGRYSEGQMAHWLLLMFADRVDVAESMISEAILGRPDNIIKEMGLKAEFTRHGLRSRMDFRRADVWSRYPKQLVLFGGLAAATFLAVRGVQRDSRARASDSLQSGSAAA